MSLLEQIAQVPADPAAPDRVARELGFTLVGHRLELFGVPLKRGRK